MGAECHKDPGAESVSIGLKLGYFLFIIAVTILLIGATAADNIYQGVLEDRMVEAVMEADTEKAIELSERGVDTELLIDSEEKIIHQAVRDDNMGALETMLEIDADLDAKTQNRELTALHIAAKTNNTEMAEKLINVGARIDSRNQIGKTPLHLAAEKGHLTIAENLIENGAEVDARSRYAMPPIHLAIRNNNPEIVDILINSGANINVIDASPLLNPNYPNRIHSGYSGRTPLHTAANNGSLEIAKTLIENGADINAENRKSNETPLHVAVSEGNVRVVETLVGEGADISLVTEEKMTALEKAYRNGQVEIVSILENETAN